MKNTFLKKASAVTLAAVMAVTFAPVASLNAFAANVGVITVGSKNVITGGGATITDDGTYVLTPGGVNTTPIEVTGSATQVTIDLNGVTSAAVKITGTAKGVKNIKIVNNGYNEQKTVEATNYPVIPEVILTGVDTAASISFSGYMIADGDSDILKYAGSNAAAATGASVNTHLYIGQLAIDDLARGNGTGADVYAVNGAVNVKELRDTHIAVLSDKANVGTTLTATAVKGKSLTKAETTYNYTFYSKELNGYGTSSYTDVRYAAGASSFENAFDTTGFNTTDIPNPTVTGVGSVSGASINTKYLSSKVRGKGFGIVKFRYSRALTLTQDDNDKWGKNVKLPYVDTKIINKSSDDEYVTDGVTYFTKDPTAYVKDYVGVALVDGTKYIIDGSTDETKKKDDELKNVSATAGQSVAILRGTTDNTLLAVNAYNELKTKEGVKVTAPTSASIVLGHTHTVGTKKDNVKNFGVVFGANNVQGAATSLGGSFEKVDDNETLTTSLEVPQVADGTYAIAKNGYTDTKVTLGTGVTYFYEQKTSQIGDEQCDFVFGSVKDATNALNAVLNGTNLNTTNYFTQAKPGENVFVAKDIKTTVKGVTAKVNVKGEISADGAKAADGTYTWIINQGYGTDAVPAYRMYRKSGEHVYTINPAEVSMLEQAGWINEGVGFKVNSVASKKGTPIYRVYNVNGGGMHFYTASAAEKDMLLANGWTEGKVVFYGADKATGIPVYRTYNTGSNNGEHNYTTNIAESDMNVKAGWRAEGVAFYVFK